MSRIKRPSASVEVMIGMETEVRTPLPCSDEKKLPRENGGLLGVSEGPAPPRRRGRLWWWCADGRRDGVVGRGAIESE